MDLPVKYDLLTPKQKREVRLHYIALQGGLCMFCKNSLDDFPTEEVLSKNLNTDLFPYGFLDHAIHLQHDHKTGWTEGAVHAYCNGVMWQYYGR